MKKAAAILVLGILVGMAACSPLNKASESVSLQGRWQLEQLGDTVLATNNSERGVPTLEFDLPEQRASGFAGCNRFFGSFTQNRDTLSFGPLGATKMACLNPNVEDRYLRILSDHILPFRISGDMLYLGEGADRLVFKRVTGPQ